VFCGKGAGQTDGMGLLRQRDDPDSQPSQINEGYVLGVLFF
jgi:hypothetical protein